MKITALVVGDETIKRPASRDYPASESRHLLVLDQDDTPLQSTVTLVIATDDKVAAPVPDLRGHVVDCSIREWAQYDGNKKHVAKGHVNRIRGIMRVEEYKPAKAA